MMQLYEQIRYLPNTIVTIVFNNFYSVSYDNILNILRLCYTYVMSQCAHINAPWLESVGTDITIMCVHVGSA